MTRYLTVSAKNRIIGEWLATRGRALPDGDLAGKGYPDPAIFPLCDYLNSIPGICTMQSCAGHVSHLPPAGERAIYKGHLWLWLSEPMARRFYDRAFDLKADAGGLIERTEILFQPYGHEIASIIFEGNNCGLLTESAFHIGRFFGNLAP